MQTIPVIAVAAWSGTGKTTLLERLIRVKGAWAARVRHEARHPTSLKWTGRERTAGA